MSDNLTVACKYVMRSNVTEWACVSIFESSVTTADLSECVYARSICLVYCQRAATLGARDSRVSMCVPGGSAASACSTTVLMCACDQLTRRLPHAKTGQELNSYRNHFCTKILPSFCIISDGWPDGSIRNRVAYAMPRNSGCDTDDRLVRTARRLHDSDGTTESIH